MEIVENIEDTEDAENIENVKNVDFVKAPIVNIEQWNQTVLVKKKFFSDDLFWLSNIAMNVWSDSIAVSICTYLIFVIFFTKAKFLEHKIYTEKRQILPIFANFSR